MLEVNDMSITGDLRDVITEHVQRRHSRL